MKKAYTKPLVYCENYKTGMNVTNSPEYAEKMKEKLTELRNTGEISCCGDKKRGDIN